ncbi:hypothetical protein IFM89_017916 [Coptis chinensis]|uniref:Pentatricopeptide repeat-containing protein n=1 Tax=Coptis chinensis TaxID=261450 RepID=A0A835LRL7_9MAGN|nr:hypothetical protein IFM89_017916 [Coptis chinensis]
MEMFMKMKNANIKPDSYPTTRLRAVLVIFGMFEEAVRLMKEMSSNGFDYDLITYSSILEVVGKIDDICNDSVP